MPSRVAVSGWISTHELQSTLVTGSGSSWSHGLLAPRPSPSVGDGYVTRKKSPVVCAAGAAGGWALGAGVAARGAIEPLVSPRASAADMVCGFPPPGRRPRSQAP